MAKLCEMIVCVDKIECEKCDSIIPSVCGGDAPFIPQNPCNSIRFEGVDNVSVNQGEDCIDLTDGVHAYDGNGVEIPFTVNPEAIDCCEVGRHEVTYKARGMGDETLPTLCLNEQPLHITYCGMATATQKRIVTVKPYGIVCEAKACCASAVC